MRKLQNTNTTGKRGVIWLFWFIPLVVFNITETESFIETKYWLFGFLPLPKTIYYFPKNISNRNSRCKG